MLFPFAPAKNRTSGPKGHKDDKVYAGDKSPAYPEDEPVKPSSAISFTAQLNRLRKNSTPRSGEVGTGFSPYINPAEPFGL
jgi:hypothetical protein